MSDDLSPDNGAAQVRSIDINDEMAQSFVDYAMSVIVSRALPDVRDGLKPVQRRIIHAMNEANLGPGTRHRKCATVVGDVMGRFHPHGDQAIYDALVRLGQDFSLLHPLVDPQGNFGTIDDPPAQMRYCVTGDTLVRTVHGTHRIDEIAQAGPEGEADIDVKVLDRRGNPVRATRFFDSGVHPVLRLRTREGFELTGTANHPVLCLTTVMGVPMLVWKLLEEIAPGDRVAIAPDAGLEPESLPFIADYLRDTAPRGGREWLSKRNVDRYERWSALRDEVEQRTDGEAFRLVEEIVDHGYLYATVDSVVDAGEERVYSIRVDSEDHSFLANGFVNHNTECRLSSISERLLEGIDEDTVDFTENYDGEHQEPSVLPARFPNLLVNGSQGIAVGMATNIPPHNLGEVVDACLHALDNPDAPVEELMRFIKGPDFPTGAYIVGTAGVRDALSSGRGSVKMRAVADVQEVRKGRTAIVVTELPYQVSQDRVMEKIADLVHDKRIEGIADLRNESSARVGTRLVIELKNTAVPQVVLNQLYKLTQLQDSFGVNTVALVDGVPRTLDVAQMIGHYLDHQMEVIERRTRFRLEKAKARAHILEGLIVAVDNIDEVVRIIRGSDDTADARGRLIERFELTEIQANAILDMPLRRLSALETEKLRTELAELHELIEELEAILADPARRRTIIAEELTSVKEKFAVPRRTRIVPDEGELTLEDLIADEELIITVSQSGYVKSVPATTYRTQGRGGRGVKAAELREDDVVAHLVHTTAHAYLLFFTNQGLVHRVKAHEIPKQARTSKGVLAQSVLPLGPEERIQAVIDTRDYETNRYLVMVTRLGQAKKTEFKEYDSRNQTLKAIRLADDDELVEVRTTNGEHDMLIFTQNGQGIRFKESDLRPMGRDTQGVRGIRLREGDRVVSAISSADDDEVLLMTSGGYGKRTALDAFPRQGRGGLGVKAIKLTRVRGRLIKARAVSKDDEVFLISSSGVGIRTQVGKISRQGRDATGVKVMDVGDNELSTFAVVAENGEE